LDGFVFIHKIQVVESHGSAVAQLGMLGGNYEHQAHLELYSGIVRCRVFLVDGESGALHFAIPRKVRTYSF